MKKSSKNLEQFNFELTTTSACNFHCDYCFENDCDQPENNLVTRNTDGIIKVMNELFESEWFRNTYSLKKINFWGGEPSLNMKVIEKVTDAFKDQDDVSFFIFTNGSRIDKLIEVIKDTRSFDIQLSYDGEPVNYKRKTLKSEPTTHIVMDAMNKLHKAGIKFQIKSTICYEDYHKMPFVYDHFKHLRNIYGDHIRYATTVDYHNVDFEKYKSVIEETLLKIAKKEIDFYKKNKSFLTNIFTANKKHCQCGKRMLTIDVDGEAYYCHGCLYSNCKPEFRFSHIFDNNFINSVRDNYEYFYNNQPIIEKCESCSALSCLRCNVTKFENSSEKDFYEKWYDYPSQKDLCKYYVMAGKIGRAMLNVLKEE